MSCEILVRDNNLSKMNRNAITVIAKNDSFSDFHCLSFFVRFLEYSLDDALIPENTSLIVVRLPRGSGSGPKVYNPV